LDAVELDLAVQSLRDAGGELDEDVVLFCHGPLLRTDASASVSRRFLT
jgi:hypothetical protein